MGRYFFYQKIVNSGGLADDTDKWFALVGLILLFEGARRALGPAMAILATVFLVYVFWGSSEWVPDVIRWKGASLKKAMSHMWITSEGVFGIALGVSTKFVFLFVLFGALLDKAGAGNYFIKMAFGALGHLRGGPAKAAPSPCTAPPTPPPRSRARTASAAARCAASARPRRTFPSKWRTSAAGPGKPAATNSPTRYRRRSPSRVVSA